MALKRPMAPFTFRHKLMAIGVAFWPGGTLDSWTKLSARSPCNSDTKTILKSSDVQISSYRIGVDRLSFLRCVTPPPPPAPSLVVPPLLSPIQSSSFD